MCVCKSIFVCECVCVAKLSGIKQLWPSFCYKGRDEGSVGGRGIDTLADII